MNANDNRCAFCNAADAEAFPLLLGPPTYVCGECVGDLYYGTCSDEDDGPWVNMDPVKYGPCTFCGDGSDSTHCHHHQGATICLGCVHDATDQLLGSGEPAEIISSRFTTAFDELLAVLRSPDARDNDIRVAAEMIGSLRQCSALTEAMIDEGLTVAVERIGHGPLVLALVREFCIAVPNVEIWRTHMMRLADHAFHEGADGTLKRLVRHGHVQPDDVRPVWLSRVLFDKPGWRQRLG